MTLKVKNPCTKKRGKLDSAAREALTLVVERTCSGSFLLNEGRRGGGWELRSGESRGKPGLEDLGLNLSDMGATE